MENQILDNQTSSNENSNFGVQTMGELSGLGQWLKISAIVSLVSLPITFFTSILTKNYTNLFGVVLGAVFAIILLNAANGLQNFSKNPNAYDLEKFGSNIRNYFLIIGILLIVAMSFAIIAIIIAILATL
jgi:uncharacterized membrane protein YidH (DUF202 family)